MRLILVFFFVFKFLFTSTYATTLTHKQLVKNSIKYHDPTQSWWSITHIFSVEVYYAEAFKKKRNRENPPPGEIILFPEMERFEMRYFGEAGGTELVLESEGCYTREPGGIRDTHAVSINGHPRSCKDMPFFRDYYRYLFSMPMNLQDEGWDLIKEVFEKEWKGQKVVGLSDEIPGG